MHKITVDKNKCIGCGACVATCPKSFRMENGKATPKGANVEEITCEKDAEKGCPVDAIKIL